MRPHLNKLLMVVALVAAAALPAWSAPTTCTPGVKGCLPTAEQCATGDYNGYWSGDETGRFALCSAAAGHVIFYAGGTGFGPCGQVVVADKLAAGDPNVGPNDCPRLTDGLPGSTWHEEYFPSTDGTELHADVYRPAGIAEGTKTPVILIVSPYVNTGGTGDPYGSPPMLDIRPTGTQHENAISFEAASIVPDIFERGYSLIVVGLRGFGASAGCDNFGGPGAQADVKSAVEWAGARPWSTGRVGMWGISAEGWTQMMALATHPAGLAAVVVQAPPIDRYAQSYMNGVPYALSPIQNTFRYTYIDLMPPSVVSDAHQVRNWATGGAQSLAGCDEQNIAFSAGSDPTSKFWTERDLTERAAGSDVPVLFSQGFMDSNVKPSVFLDVWSTLQGPRRAWFGQYEHVHADSPDHPFLQPGLVGRGGFRDETLRWFDTYVKGIPAFETGVDQDPPIEVERSDGQWRTEQQWPPGDAQAFEVPILRGTYLDVRGNSAEAAHPVRECQSGSVDGASPCLRTRNGVGTWTFTRPFTVAEQMSGVPRLFIDVDTTAPSANLIALVYDVDSDGSATLLDRGAFLIRKSGRTKFAFDLYPQDWLVAEGHRIGILLSGADDGWFSPVSTGLPVRVLGGTMILPFVPSPRASDLSGSLSQAGRDRSPFDLMQSLIERRTVS